MSHFTMIAFGTNYEQEMEPFYEGTNDRKYTEFKDTEDESRDEYLNKTMTVVTLPDGTQTNEYDQKYKVFDSKSFDSNYVFPEGSVKEEKKFCEYFKTFEQYMEEWCGSESVDSEMNRYGYWHNPKSKWDWYSVGGRWTGYFKPKHGAFGKLGKSGAFDNKPKEGWVDSIKIRDIDLQAMFDEAAREANLEYDKVEQIAKGRNLPSWEKTVAECEKDYNKAREIYNSDPIHKEFSDAGIHVWGGLYETYRNSREEYVKMCVNRTMVPFAVLKDGQIYEKGEMGWWGSVSDEKDQDKWNEEFWKLFNSVDPETVVTLLDCHI
jgi:hypothetical protein